MEQLSLISKIFNEKLKNIESKEDMSNLIEIISNLKEESNQIKSEVNQHK